VFLFQDKGNLLFWVSIIRPNSSPKCFVIFILAIERDTGEISSYF
jgi:hypothetical protein